jgi:hypothetical protein
MNTLNKLLARIHAAELAAKVRPRHTHHARHEADEHDGRMHGARSQSAHRSKRTAGHHPKHRKGHRR